MDKTLLSLLLVFFLAFTIFTSIIIFGKPLAQYTRASQDTTVSAQSSLIFAWPLNVEANGQSISTITVFARTNTGKSIPDKQVRLTTSIGAVKQPETTTDSEGKALFQLTSSTAGLAEIQAIVDNITIDKSISVKFE
jgi:hypothetical protein